MCPRTRRWFARRIHTVREAAGTPARCVAPVAASRIAQQREAPAGPREHVRPPLPLLPALLVPAGPSASALPLAAPSACGDTPTHREPLISLEHLEKVTFSVGSSLSAVFKLHLPRMTVTTLPPCFTALRSTYCKRSPSLFSSRACPLGTCLPPLPCGLHVVVVLTPAPPVSGTLWARGPYFG